MFRSRRRFAKHAEEALEAVLARTPPPLTERLADGSPIEPAFRTGIRNCGFSPPLQDDFNCEFLRAGLVMDDPADNAGDARIVRVEDVRDWLDSYDALCVHIYITRRARALWQRTWCEALPAQQNEFGAEGRTHGGKDAPRTGRGALLHGFFEHHQH